MATRLYRSTSDCMLGGVCGGLATYFGIDSVIVRFVFALAILSGLSPLIYIVLWIVMPQEPAVAPPTVDPTGEWRYDPYTGEERKS
ncbi:PspC domain-containing protein [Candidatus Oscillochloris fontis]|uniref:PspC domain-containing protein n=1 Tax=Candidatus Oscillochloris fontis TaxID=2496868 RepID=UPI00101C372C|nr:PspC domain-containing protein [Candidatus Oscillochloris fontis]